MARDLEDSTSRSAEPRRVKAVACVGGVSFEHDIPADEIQDHVREAESIVWVDVADPGPDEIAFLIDEFGLHPLAFQDGPDGRRRPKVEEFKGFLRIVTYAAIPGDQSRELRTSEVDMFVGRNFVVAIHQGRVPALEETLARWTRGGSMLREGIGFLAYAALDAIINSFAPFIGGVEDEIDAIEIALLTTSDEEVFRDLLRLKRELASLRRVLFPMRAVFEVLLRGDQRLFTAGIEVYLREVLDHVLRLLDDLDVQRDMASSALEVSMAINAKRLNRTMKTLEVITVAVAVVASVYGAYGMNVEGLPLASSPWGFWVVGFGTIMVVAVALVAGWRLRWW